MTSEFNPSSSEQLPETKDSVPHPLVIKKRVVAMGKDDKKRIKKDPNLPKSAKSALNIFSNAQRDVVKAELPGLKYDEVTKVLSQKWRELSDVAKEPYESIARDDKERYKKELELYNSKKVIDVMGVSSSEDSDNDSTEETKDYRPCVFNALTEMLTMPYFKNEAAASGAVHNVARHEDALVKVLIKHGFHTGNIPLGIKRDDALKWIKEPELASNIPNGVFIEQPFGTHNSPDFIIKVSDKVVIFLEAKSVKGTSPMYNSGGISKDFLYVFCSKKTNQTTIYMGSSIITVEQQRLIDEYIEATRKRDDELNAKLRELDSNHRGVSYYTRPMINQSGGKSYTDYFEHKQRKQAEEYALNWVKELCEL